MIKKLFLLTLCMGGLLPAVANDTAGTLLPTGEIEFTKQPEIVLKHEALLLSYTASVDYLFENTSSAPIRQTVFFPIPTTPIICYECDSHAFDFKVWSNGREVQPQLHRNITLNGTDVTRYFELMHVTDYTQHITFDPDTYGQDLEDAAAPLRKLPREEQEKLEKIGLLAKGCLETNPDTGKCTHNPQVYHLVPANYQQTVSYYWQQEFPPHQTVHIRHTYIPSFTQNSVGQPYAIAHWNYEKPHDWWQTASYIVTTANNWQTPITRFHMLVWGDKQASVSAWNAQQWQASDARLSPRNYILVNRKDFVPSQEILFELASASSHFNNPSTPALALFRVDGPAPVRATPNGKKFTQLANDTYVWAYPSEQKDWWVVLLDEQTTGFMHRQNLRPFGK